MVGISKEQANRLKAKLVELVKNLEVDEIFLACFRRGNIFTANTQEEIESVRTTQGRASKLLHEILASPKSIAYDRLIEALVESKQRPLAISLDENLTKEYEIKRQRILDNDEVDTRQQKMDSTCMKDLDVQREIQDQGGEMHFTLMKITEEERASQQCEGVYPIRQIKSNRLAVIINNFNFLKPARGPQLQERLGTNCDEVNIKKILDLLNFTVTAHNDKYDEEIHQIFKDLCVDKDLINCEILMVFILSHGCRGAVYGSNAKMVYIQDILDCFTPEKCPALVDKPKIFFIQACQVDPMHHPPAPTEMWEMRAPPDTLLAFSTCAGYESWKNELGSWFIRTAVQVLARNAHNTDVLSLLKQICRIVVLMGSKTNRLQLPETRHSRFKKCFLLS